MYPAVLIVDDESTIIESLEGILSDDGFDVIHAFNGYEALKQIDAHAPDIVLLDIWMPGMDGIDTLKEIRRHHPSLPVIMITGHGSIESAVDATKSGAFDFLEKPLSIDKVILSINNALNFRKLEEENRYLRKKTIERNAITGTSPAVQTLYSEIMSAAPTDTSILITGENGTGKEMVARTIHQFSRRPEGPFIIVNCAAIPEARLEPELFGHEKGAFDGATAKNRGKFELAAGGTLFLDEIGDMPPNTQAKMLRALESKTFQRMGSSRTLEMDVRVIASSNKDLEAEIRAERFREDLFFRLNVIPIHVPPLRERIEDIPMLVDFFLKQLAEHSSAPEKTLSPEALELLKQWHWKGNVRELKNLMERLSIMVENPVIGKNDMPSPYNPDSGTHAETGDVRNRIFTMERLDQAKTAFETEFIRFRVDQMDGDIQAAARQMGTSVNFIKKRVSRS